MMLCTQNSTNNMISEEKNPLDILASFQLYRNNMFNKSVKPFASGALHLPSFLTQISTNYTN